ncbi:hypothetical protein FOMPIDRAFT_1123352, partial [Fomitopsis schrenkii]
YVGRDYPHEYPVGNLQPVMMTLHESIHFSLSPTDDIASEEWRSLGHPVHYGKTHLGPEHRFLSTVFGHQMHCLQILYLGLQHQYGRHNNMLEVDRHHLQHCLNYLRQTFLCDATDSLEEGDFLSKNYSMHTRGETLICRDWISVFRKLDENQSQWEEWSNERLGHLGEPGGEW